MGLVLGGPKAHRGLLLHRTVHYNPTSSKHLVFSVAAIPEQLQGQMSVLRYFASYMEQHLMKVGASCLLGAWVWLCYADDSVPTYGTSGLMKTLLSKGGDLPSIDDLGQPALLLLQWVKTDQALLMLFSNGTLQVCVGHSGDAQTPMGRRGFVACVRSCLPQPTCTVQLWVQGAAPVPEAAGHSLSSL